MTVFQLLLEPFCLLNDAFELLLIDLVELVGLQLNYALLELPVLLHQFADGFFQLAGAGKIDLSAGTRVV